MDVLMKGHFYHVWDRGNEQCKVNAYFMVEQNGYYYFSEGLLSSPDSWSQYDSWEVAENTPEYFVVYHWKADRNKTAVLQSIFKNGTGEYSYIIDDDCLQLEEFNEKWER